MLANYYEILIKVFVSVLIIYYLLNLYVRYHISMKREYLVFYLYITIFSCDYFDKSKMVEWFWFLLISGLIFFLVQRFILKNQNNGYVFFHIKKSDYDDVLQILIQEGINQNVPESQILYHRKKPYLVCFPKKYHKETKKIMKAVDQVIQKRTPKFNWFDLIQAMVLLIALIVIWRF